MDGDLAAGRTDQPIVGFERTLELLPDNVKAPLSLARSTMLSSADIEAVVTGQLLPAVQATGL